MLGRTGYRLPACVAAPAAIAERMQNDDVTRAVQRAECRYGTVSR